MKNKIFNKFENFKIQSKKIKKLTYSDFIKWSFFLNYSTFNSTLFRSTTGDSSSFKYKCPSVEIK